MNSNKMMDNTLSKDLRKPSSRIHTINISDSLYGYQESRSMVAQMFDDEDFPDRYRRKRMPFFSIFTRDIEQYFEEMDKYFEEMFKEAETKIPSELVRERELPEGGKIREIGPFVYGYSVTVGPDGKPVIREFGNIKPTLHGKKPVEVKDKREPLVDIFNEEDSVKVIAELPGVEKKNINLNIEDKTLTVSVEKPRTYYKKIELPVNVDTAAPQAQYRNGILEINLKKPKDEKPEGKKIDIK